MKKMLGLFEAKTKLSKLCDQVARTREGVTITRRGKPLVRILPVEERPPSILERWLDYTKLHARREVGHDEDFEAAARSRNVSDFEIAE